jgi:hypothetical protein
MNDDEYLMHCLHGDRDAYDFCKQIVMISNVWDDLIDQDKTIPAEMINKAFYASLIEIPCNPFFQRFISVLTPIMANGIMNWHISNTLVTKGERALEIAHVLRYSAGDVICQCVLLIGGMDWARQVCPELRMRIQKDSLENFKKEVSHA